MPAAASFVRQVQIQGATHADPGVRLRVAHRLGAADLHPTGLAPAALLLVRRIGMSRLHRSAIVPLHGEDRRSYTAWERHTNQELAHHAAHARRPLGGAIPASTDAILFADEAEALACFALAWRQGLVARLWWCSALLRYWRVDGTALISLLRQKARLAPAALHRLWVWNQLVNVLEALDDPVALTVLSAIAQQFELPQLGALLGPHAPRRTVADGVPIRLGPVSGPLPLAPWAEWLPAESTTGLSRAQAALAGVSLMLQLQPRRLRAPAVTSVLHSWWAQTAAGPEGQVERPEVTSLGQGAPQPEVASSGQVDSEQAAEQPSQAGSEPAASAADAGQERRRASSRGPQAVLPAVEEGAPAAAASSPLAEVVHPVRASPPGAAPSQPWSRSGDAPPWELSARAMWTGLAGVFYLINLMEMLGLPGCCEAACQLASTVGPWGVLDGLARALLASTGTQYRADPVWEVLAQLDGRAAGQAPGSDFVMPAGMAWPAEWTGHPAFNRCAQEPPQAGAPLMAGLPPDFVTWLAVAAPYARARFDSILARGGGAAPLETYLAVAGRLHVTGSHLDIIIRLDAISLPLRIAGLDQDPGWRAEWGRVILFHFE